MKSTGVIKLSMTSSLPVTQMTSRLGVLSIFSYSLPGTETQTDFALRQQGGCVKRNSEVATAANATAQPTLQ